MNDFLTMLELCTFYIDYKNVKFKVINFSGRTCVKYFRQTKLLQFCKTRYCKGFFPFLVKNNC